MKGIEQGTTLAGRYELRHQLARSGRDEQWLARDRTLEREVTVALFPADGPYADAALDSARRTAGVEDPRLLRVLDVGRENDVAYVVSESVHGAESIASMLQFGTLHPEEARRLIGEAASGLANAASRGLHHQDLTPHSILSTRGGAVLVTGLPIAAALAGKEDVPGDRSSRDDATALVRILYAAITGRWPGSDRVPGLERVEPGPDGRIPTADSLAQHVPGDIDALADDALNDAAGPSSPRELARQLTPWSSEPIVSGQERARTPMFGDPSERPARTSRGAGSAAHVAEAPAGTSVQPATTDSGSSSRRGPLAAGLAAIGAAGAAGAAKASSIRSSKGPVADHSVEDATMVGRQPQLEEDDTTTYRPVRAPEPAAYDVDDELEPPAPLGFQSGMEADRQSSTLAMGIVAVCVLIALALAAIGVSQIGSHTGGAAQTSASGSPTAGASPSAKSSASHSPSPTSSAKPSGQKITVRSATSYDPQGTGDEHSELAGNVLDGNTYTSWKTRTYGSAEWGGLKTGAGLALDLGSPQQVGSVVVTIPSMPCTIQVYVGDSPSNSGSLLGTIENGSGQQTVTGNSPLTGRYVTLWINKLSPIGGHLYRTRISEVEVRS